MRDEAVSTFSQIGFLFIIGTSTRPLAVVAVVVGGALGGRTHVLWEGFG